jgi:hypothetical protein
MESKSTLKFICEYCKNKFITKANLTNHQRSAKYCLKIQCSDSIENYICIGCKKVFTQKNSLHIHQKTCTSININKNYDIIVLDLERKLHISEERNKIKDSQLVCSYDIIKHLQEQLSEIAKKAVSRPITVNNNTTIEIDDYRDENEEKCLDDDITIGEYKLEPLNIGGEYNIEYRDEDGYINVTNLCKAGKKHFNDWKKLDKTKVFLNALSKCVLISLNLLIKHSIGETNHEQYTWAHPQIAINISQWISPKFDVKVSGWIYEVMMTGKVDICSTKTYLELQKENKGNEQKIKVLTKKYVKSQSREQYPEKYVVYLITTRLLRKERRYILGKATNLTNRLSTYNKTDEHIVIYYQECKDENTMGIVENMVFNKLQEYREQANRERFILPKNMEESYFIDKIKVCVNFFSY